MPKKNSASIKIVMLKIEKDGKHPIAIRICWNRKVASRYTGVWIEPQYWDGNEVGRKCLNSATYNILIRKCFSDIENRKLEYESKGIEYSVYDLVEEREVPQSKLDFKSLEPQKVYGKAQKSFSCALSSTDLFFPRHLHQYHLPLSVVSRSRYK